jgi:NAD(P)-dependent dehydrogenase (short-subunit alcohol dehydrogenase family)
MMNEATGAVRRGIGADLAGTRALIIGAAYGVGPVVVEALLAAGAKVAVDTPDLADTAFVPETADIPRFFDDCCAALGGLDLLVVASRPVKSKPVLEMTPEEMREVAEAEMVVPALQMQEAARRMSASGYGRIVVFASMSAKTGVHHNVAPMRRPRAGFSPMPACWPLRRPSTALRSTASPRPCSSRRCGQ